MSFTSANGLIPLRLTGTQAVAQSSRANPPGSIADLTARLAAGDEEAFRQFHARYFDRLYLFLLVVARGREHEAQEALQQTMLRVARYARVFESEEAFWSWLKVVARSAARDAGRKQSRYEWLLRKFARWREEQPVSDANENERLQLLLKDSLQGLTPADRSLLEAKYIAGDSVSELADRIGTSEKALESRLLRLRRDLRAIILRKLRNE